MTVYLNFYIIIYVLTLIKINYLLSNFGFFQDSQNSLSFMFIYILKFSKFKTIILMLFLSLAGLPPFILFFIKFNYLINLLYKLNFFLIFLIFLIFFLNMLFYIQIFFHKNFSISLKLIKPTTLRVTKLSSLYSVVWFTVFIFISIFFFTDLMFIVKLFINGNI